MALKHFIILVFVTVFLSGCQEKTVPKKNLGALPFLSAKKDTVLVIDGKTRDTLIHQKTPSFSLINQDSLPFGSADVKDKIIVAEFFFTTCPSICQIVSQQLKRVYATYGASEDFIILSHTIFPEQDTPEKLKKYSQNIGVTNANWQFLTGPKDSIHHLANFGYQSTVYADPERQGEEGLMHSGTLVLVDQNSRIRGLYDGKDSLSINRLIADIPKLKQI